MHETIPISKFKATCLKLLDNVQRTGKMVLVTRKGVPIALVVPPPPPSAPQHWLGCLKDRVQITGDVLSPVVEPSDWDVLRK